MYDLKKDPHQLKNVGADPAYTATRAELEMRLLDELKATGDPRRIEDGKFFETSPMPGPVNDAEGEPRKVRAGAE